MNPIEMNPEAEFYFYQDLTNENWSPYEKLVSTRSSLEKHPTGNMQKRNHRK